MKKILFIGFAIFLFGCDLSSKTIVNDNQESDNDVEVEYKKAIQLTDDASTFHQGLHVIKKLADQGYAKAQLQLGGIYEFGLSDEGVNIVKAEYWYKKAANQKLPEALNELGNFYFKQAEGTQNQEYYKNSFTSYSKAVDLGYTDSISMLSVFYERGIVVSKNDKKSIELLKQAVDKNNSIAMFNLAQRYEEVPSFNNDKIIFELYKRSHELGYEPSTINLSIKYEKGLGVTKNIDEAINLILPLAYEGNDFAQFNLTKLYVKKGDAEEANYWRGIYDKNTNKNSYYDGSNGAIIFD